MDTDTRSARPDGDGSNGSHSVRFYADDAALLDEAAGFADAALSVGGAAIVIATNAHCAGIRRQLAAPDRARFLDADLTLALLLADGWPDEARFHHVFGPLLAEAGPGPVHMFCEMPALLCAQGRYQAAVRLEQLSHALCADRRVSLFCAYPWRLFPDAAQAQAFEDICAEHGRACGRTVHGADLDLKGRSLAQARREQKAPEGEASRRREPAPHVGREQRRQPREAADGGARQGEGMHRVGPDGTILWASRAELQMLGYRWEEYVGRHIANFHVDAELVDLILDTLLSGGSLAGQPARLRCRDGSIRHVRMRASACFEDGRLRYGACFTRDDPARHDAAGALLRRDSQLLNAPVAVALLMAPDLRIRQANRHFRELFGRRELTGKRLVEALPQLRHGALEAALEQVFETGEPYCEPALGLVLADAAGMPVERYFTVNLEALYNAGGERHGVMAVVVDVSTHLRARRAGPAPAPSTSSREQAADGKDEGRRPGRQ
ncbi:PAS domain-containing protein [Massilia sp. G4R7]|uniref:PAS domain-containing protein n=1 Tax=Massilia phyllostachyos TaxID=2898585 RepID=A0ABS8Q995_9BURK|nr:PAS domain-containing protein [Massilia phyllostachyos]MCD2518325.1 PAS domain-containing protein [Massilia phyllostachyos]